MKDKMKAGLLKTRGIIKKAVKWTPLLGIIGGLVAFGVALGVGTTKEKQAINEFKKTDMFTETYSAVYEEASEKYKSGEMNVYNFNETIEHIDSNDYVYEVLENAGPEADEYRALVKSSKAIQLCSIPGVVVALGSPFLLIPWWAMEPSVCYRLSKSAENDFDMANELLASGEPPKKNEPEEEKEDDEEDLPNIEDSYYRE